MAARGGRRPPVGRAAPGHTTGGGSRFALDPGARRAAAAARAAGAATGDLLCFLIASTTTIEPGWHARLAAPVDGATVVGAAPLVHPLRSPAVATPHDGGVLVRQHHTFDHRARQFLDAFRRHRL